MKKIVLIVLLALAVVPAAQAAATKDTPDSRLDAVASGIAGHTVHVYCEDDPTQWTLPAFGYTFRPQYTTTVWVHPWICAGLHKLLARAPLNTIELPMNLAAAAIHVLVHESVHQRGGAFADCYTNGPDDLGCEGRTDCEALKLDEQAAIDLGVPAKVKERRYTYRLVHRHGKNVWVEKMRWVMVRNPDLRVLGNYQRMFHDALPPQYQGDC